MINNGSVTKEATMPRKGTGAGGRPPKAPGEKAVTMAIAVQPDLRDQMKAEAADRNISVSQLAQEYLRRGLEADRRDKGDQEAAAKTVETK